MVSLIVFAALIALAMLLFVFLLDMFLLRPKGTDTAMKLVKPGNGLPPDNSMARRIESNEADDTKTVRENVGSPQSLTNTSIQSSRYRS
jgi:hypothetical protein